MAKEEKKAKKIGKKQIGIIIGVFVLALVGFGLYKGLVLNRPNQSPQEITQKLVDFMQREQLTDAEKAEISSFFTQSARERAGKLTSDEGSEPVDDEMKPVITIKSVVVDERAKTATSTIEISAWIINVPIQFKFVQEGDFLRGYRWVINEVIGIPGDNDSAGKSESVARPGEKVSIGDDWSIIVSAPSDYISADEFIQPEDGNKFVAVELQYFNNSDTSDTVNVSNLTLRDAEGHSYDMTFMASKKPDFFGGDTVTAKGTLRGWVTYEVPKAATIIKAVYAGNLVTVTVNY